MASAQAISLLPSAATTPGTVTRFFQSTTTKSVKLRGNNCSLTHFQLGMSIRKNTRDAPPAQAAERRLSSSNNDTAAPGDVEDGVVLGTSKLPSNTDLFRFDSLLFQWANSLCQGANLPLPAPLKVDKLKGGVRLGFTTIGEGKIETPVYIDCLVFPPEVADGQPIFRAIRNGAMKEKVPPGEERIMRSLLQALQKSTEIASM